MDSSDVLLEAKGICKDYGPVRVLFDVDFSLRRGEVHALIGENGAGKSTLVKILCGLIPPTQGELTYQGQPWRPLNVSEAERQGVVMIHQEFNLAEDLTVEENIFLGRELRKGWLLDRRTMRRLSRGILAELETDIDPKARVRGLSVSQKQMVEIAKAISRKADVIIMDEPTAVLTSHEVEILFKVIRRLVQNGVSIVYISHKLDEVKEISQRVTILRDGHRIATEPTAALSPDEMAVRMVGRSLEDMFLPKAPPPEAEPILAVRDVTVPGFAHQCSFELYRGEILGFAGLIGSGRTELFEGIFGLRPRTGGFIERAGRLVEIRSVKDAIDCGMVYLSEDRKGKGLITSMELAPNLTLMSSVREAGLWLRRREELQALEQAIGEYDIKAPGLRSRVAELSGGNQQKLALAKVMAIEPQVIVLDEPTRGIDVGTKQQIYQFIHDLAATGKSVVVISSEMQEIIGLCHRVVVMRSGRIAGVLSGDDITEEEIMLYATGVKGAA
ncbi:MAG TPA: sugar ABC transporter ATP-binding protein [Limnochordia bacterium]|nr:sugar ABC transporter ATP-binding protein [Limnochordia bacterium]